MVASCWILDKGCAAVKESFIGMTWQRHKIHFTRKLLTHKPAKERNPLLAKLKNILVSLVHKLRCPMRTGLWMNTNPSLLKRLKQWKMGLKTQLDSTNFLELTLARFHHRVERLKAER